MNLWAWLRRPKAEDELAGPQTPLCDWCGADPGVPMVALVADPAAAQPSGDALLAGRRLVTACSVKHLQALVAAGQTRAARDEPAAGSLAAWSDAWQRQ
jgi:hypothetical protein